MFYMMKSVNVREYSWKKKNVVLFVNLNNTVQTMETLHGLKLVFHFPFLFQPKYVTGNLCTASVFFLKLGVQVTVDFFGWDACVKFAK